MGASTTPGLPGVRHVLALGERWDPATADTGVAVTAPLPEGAGPEELAAAVAAHPLAAVRELEWRTGVGTDAAPGTGTGVGVGARVGADAGGADGPAREPDPGPPESAASRCASALAAEPFDAAHAPLIRAAAVREGARSVLCLAAHRTALDAHGLRLLAAQLTGRAPLAGPGEPAAEGTPGAPLPGAPLPGEGEPGNRAAQLASAQDELAGAAPLLEFPLEAPRGTPRAPRAVTRKVADPQGALARSPGRHALLAAYVATLRLYTGQRDLTVLVDLDRRADAGQLGCWTEPAPLRLRCEAGTRAAKLVAEVSRRLTRAERGPVLVPEIHTPLAGAEPERPPRFTAAFSVLPAGPPGTDLGAVHVVPPQRPASEVRLTWDATGPRGGHLEMTYDAALVADETAERFGRHVLAMLSQLLGHPQASLGDLPVLGAEDTATLREWGTAADIATPLRPVPLCVADRAREAGEATAVVHEGTTLTYRELDALADAFAHRLLRAGVRVGEAVALCMPRCPALLVAMVGVHRAGAAALMLDPKAPDAYLDRFLRLAEARLLVTTPDAARDLPSAGHALRLTERGEPAGTEAPQDPDGTGSARTTLREPHLDDLAYLVQTSGSTGLPKLVAVTHRGVAHSAHAQAGVHGVHAAAQGGWTFPPQTNVSVTVVVWAFLITGATLHIASDERLADPERLRDWLIDSGVTQVFVVAPLAEALLGVEWPEQVPLRSLLTGSDRVRRWAPAKLPFEVGNWYGANEVNIVTSPLLPWERRITSHTATGADREVPPPIGRAWPGVRMHVLDPALRPVPPGVVGELAVSGPEQARGYLTARQTAERFVPDPFGPRPGGRLYLTGDLVRYRPDGALEHRGRADDQLKISGMRVELGEVEQALLGLPGVVSAAVAAPEDPRGTTRLVAYVTGEGAADTGGLRRAVAGRLPDHMVPHVVIRLERMPLNSGDKIDRRALPAPDWEELAASSPREAGPGADAAAPDSELEHTLIGVWEEVLDVSPLGVHANFFLLGGDSLRAARAVRLIGSRSEAAPKVRQLMLNPTPAELARELAAPTG